MTPSRVLPKLLLPVVLLLPASPVGATEIRGVQNAALDQPQLYGLFRRPGPPVSPPLTDVLGFDIFAIRAFLDTGASGVILSESTADLFGVQRSLASGPPPQPPVLFQDVGVGGAAQFHVSEPLLINVAPFAASTDPGDPAAYSQSFGPLRAQIGPLGAAPLPFLGGIDVFGMPIMAGKVVVMDPKPLNPFGTDPFAAGPMQTYLYDPGTPYRPATADSDPGIPPTERSVALTYASVERFTSLTPPTAEGPVLAANPFIGPNPLAKLDPTVPAGTTPGVTITLGDKRTTGSFLLDTGAAVSIMSREQALQLNVRYRPGTPVLELFDPANPSARGTPLPDQFRITLTGIGGDLPAAGFYADSLLVRTRESNPQDDNDPAHIRYGGAPVLVADITLATATGQTLTLDGLFAMNLLVASLFFSEPFTFGDFNPGPFDWVVFDQPEGLLRLDLAALAAVPEPGTLALVLAGLALLALVARRRVPRA